MPTKNINLVIGPSSAGKSTYINSVLNKEKTAVVLANEIKNKSDLNKDCIIHYNAFRPFKNALKNVRNKLSSDPVLKLILKEGDQLNVQFLVLSKSTLLKRIILRRDVEPKLRESKEGKYPAGKILKLVLGFDYSNFYERWFSLFEKHQIPVNFVDASSMKFSDLSGIEEAREIIRRNEKENYSSDEVKSVIDRFQFGYQKMDLPHGHSTKGKSRQSTLDVIFKNSLENKSILDIGSAYGYFAFEAEKRKAKKVVGTELKNERFIGASIIKEMLGSDVVFLNKDIFSKKMKRKFDIILLLNVIHHLNFPMYSLKVLSQLCNEQLIIEFPTVADKKFQSTLKSKMKDNENPIIGVGSYKDSDQTFLFNDEAIKRILLDHNSFFSRIEFCDSPFENNRRIAFCYK